VRASEAIEIFLTRYSSSTKALPKVRADIRVKGGWMIRHGSGRVVKTQDNYNHAHVCQVAVMDIALRDLRFICSNQL